MFYPVDSLRRGGIFYLCWVADSWPLRFATITHRQLCAQDVREICDALQEVMTRESGSASARFSLRLSSQLLRGVVRLYQRKVAVFLAELCMLNATVIKHTNKKWHPEQAIHRRPALPRLPRVVNIDDEERVEERIQESGNAVANIDDITLREATIPEILISAVDDFGEEHPERALRLLTDRTLEQMLAAAEPEPAQLSGAELAPRPAPRAPARAAPAAARMERLSDRDDLEFRKSAAMEKELLMQSELEITQILAIPNPDIPNPDIQNPEFPVPTVEQEDYPQVTAADIAAILEQAEELEAAEPRRRRRRRLMIDQQTKINTKAFRSRLDNVHVELRCESSTADVVADPRRLPADEYLRRPARCGWRPRPALADTLVHMFRRNLHYADRDRDDLEEILALPAMRKRARASALPKISEEEEPPAPAAERAMLAHTDDNIPELSVQKTLEDISDLPTQVLVLDQTDDGVASKKPCRIGVMSFKNSQKMAHDEMTAQLEMTEEAHPPRKPMSAKRRPSSPSKVATRKRSRDRKSQSVDYAAPVHEKAIDTTVLVYQAAEQYIQDKTVDDPRLDGGSHEKQVSQMLEAAGLADGGREAETRTQRSETPLGSLDRTQVDLGDSDVTTDTQRMMKKEWGTQGTMEKVMHMHKLGAGAVTVGALLAAAGAARREAAARCFTSLLKLKQHSFLNLEKDSNCQIIQISFGSKLQS